MEELAAAWNCEIGDIFHHFQQGHIRLGIALSGELFYGVDENWRTIGAYLVTGVLTIPKTHSVKWEFEDKQVMVAKGFTIETDYPPTFGHVIDIYPCALSAPYFKWAPNCDWDNSESDYQKIKNVQKGYYQGAFPEESDKIIIHRSEVVVHAVERTRFEKENNIYGEYDLSDFDADMEAAHGAVISAKKTALETKPSTQDDPDQLVTETMVQPEDTHEVEKDSSANENKEQSIFDPLPLSGIAKMFKLIDFSKWKTLADQASKNGLIKARVSAGSGNAESAFDPERVAEWLVNKGHYTRERADHVLANNLPPRSAHMKEFY